MYFNHAFRKSFLPRISGGAVAVQAAGSYSPALLAAGAGTLGFFDAAPDSSTYNQTLNPASSTTRPFVIGQASYYTNDKITPYLGGYQEAVRSKVINPKYIHRVIKFSGAPAQNQVKDVCVCNLECGKTYNLRMDLKGAPALRFLSHNIYKTLAAYTGCCTSDCSATCTGALVDPTTVNINWATQIINDPILSQFLQVTKIVDFNGDTVAEMGEDGVDTQAQFAAAIAAYSPDPAWDPTATEAATIQSCMTVAVAYADTKFGACTFTPTDYYGVQPLNMLFSMVDETGDPCNVQCFEVSGQYAADGTIPLPYNNTTTFPGQQAEGLLESVVRELILDGRYRQEAFPDSSRVDSFRMREIESNPIIQSLAATAAASPTGVIYDRVIILHTVPRFNNPTGTFDNDQYMLVFHVPTGTTTTAITNFVIASANAAQGSGAVVLETY